MNFINIIKKTRRELFWKFVTSILIQGLALIIPVYWSRVINYATDSNFSKAIQLVIVTLILSLFNYLWNYFNKKTWYDYYNKIYLEYNNYVMNSDIDDVTLGEYTNIINNDIDIIGTFIGNGVTRIIQVLEFLVIYAYFFKINFYIFIVSLIVSILMVGTILYFGPKIEKQNKIRKDDLDLKTINIHNIYDVIKRHKKVNEDNFFKSTFNYLESNKKFNLYVYGMIYLVLGLIEFCRYGIILYCLYLVSIYEMEIGTIILIYSYYAKIITNFEVLGTIDAELQSFKVSLKRINRIVKKDC